ncbi:MAG: PCP reductase family protein [Nitrospinota bacterium]
MSEPSHQSAGHSPENGEVVWTQEALERVKKAPEFVRAGIRKLMQKRARELGQPIITSEFLTQIRNESMLRVAKSMKKFGFEELRMEAFDVAKSKMSRNLRRGEVIEEIRGFLAERTSKNEEILEKFKAYFQILPDRGIPWTPEANERLDKLPPSVASVVAQAAEEGARRRKEKVVSPQLLEAVLKDVLSPEATKTGEGEGSSFWSGQERFPAHPKESDLPLSLEWAEEALQRLHRIPLQFARNLVIQKVEGYAQNRRIQKITLTLYLEASGSFGGPFGKRPHP